MSTYIQYLALRQQEWRENHVLFWCCRDRDTFLRVNRSNRSDSQRACGRLLWFFATCDRAESGCGHLNPKTVKCVFALIWMRKHNTFSSEKACQDQAKWTEPSEPHLQEQEPQEPLWLNFWLDWYLVRNWPWAAECLSHRLLLQLGNPKISNRCWLVCLEYPEIAWLQD